MNRTLSIATAIVALSISTHAQTYRVLVKEKGEGWGYINLHGDMVIPAEKKGTFKPFTKEGLATVALNRKTVYFLDTSGKRIDPDKNFEFNTRMGFNPDDFSDGLIPFQKGKKWGYLNTKLEIAIEAKYDDADPFSEGLALVKQNKDWIIIDKKGKETPVQIAGLSGIKHFEGGLAPFDKDGMDGFLDATGKEVIPAKFIGVGYFSGGLAWAKVEEGKNKLVGFINRKGEWVIQPTYPAVDDFDPVSGIARVKKDDQWAYIKKDGSFLTIAQGEKLRDFKEGLAIAEVNDQVGFLGTDGKWAIKPEFSDARHFKNGFAAVKKDGMWGIINKKGEWMVKPAYDGIRDVEVIK